MSSGINLAPVLARLGLDTEDRIVRAAQALAILETLQEKIPEGTEVVVRRYYGLKPAWCVHNWDDHYYSDESLTDALGQMTTVLALKGAGR